MQFLIFAGLLTSAFAGDFNQKVQMHNAAVAATRAQVTRLGDAQKKFQALMSQCAPKAVNSQAILLNCSQRFLQLNWELQPLKNNQADAQKAVDALPADFTAAKGSLNKTLAESGKILALVIDTPQKLASAYFDANTVYVQKQFERASHDAFLQARIRQYCNGLPSQIDLLSQTSHLALNTKASFALLYKQNIKIRNTIVLAQAAGPICGKTYDLKTLNGILAKMNARLTTANFESYKKEVCKKPRPETQMTSADCMHLALSPYSIQWLEASGGVK